MVATTRGKEFALEKLAERRAASTEAKKIDNASLYAGSPMYFYCIACDGLADVLPESYTCSPLSLCEECEALKVLGWLE